MGAGSSRGKSGDSAVNVRRQLTLRQVEVLRAVMVSGSLAGAAKVLNVAAPGLSRLVKYTEQSLGYQLFERHQGRLVPTPMSEAIFEQINAVFDKMENLRYVIQHLDAGTAQELKIGSVPSIASVMVPRAVAKLHRRHPDLKFDINILKTEEAIDFLLLGRGEMVAMSYRLDHPALTSSLLASGELFCIVPERHPLAARTSVSAEEIVRFPLIGIDPSDPYGRIMTDIFRSRGIPYEISIRARFGSTVCALVREGLGIAVIDQFTIAGGSIAGIGVLRIEEPTKFDTWITTKSGSALSSYGENFIAALRREMKDSMEADRRAR